PPADLAVARPGHADARRQSADDRHRRQSALVQRRGRYGCLRAWRRDLRQRFRRLNWHIIGVVSTEDNAMSNANDSRPANPQRRSFFGIAGAAVGAAALAGALPQLARADDLPHLTTDDPTAQALGYTEDATKVDAKKYPTHQAGQTCANCNFFHG